MGMWKYFTLCRENEVSAVHQLKVLGLTALFFTACVAGPTPHPAESEMASPGDPGASPTDEIAGSDNSEGGSADASTSGDALMISPDTTADTSDVGPDVGDTASDTASDTEGSGSGDGSGDAGS